jgi:glycerol-3-phosphate acyltransferase PlsY
MSLLLIIGAYLIGSLSTAIIVCRLMQLPDPRTQGSGNPGATNVLRIGGKKAAAITLFGDGLKGYLPVLLANLTGQPAVIVALTGLAAFIGHLYPLFFGFKGGKGVATALGVQLGMHWALGLAVAATWLVIARLLKISSLAALVSMGLAPIFSWLIWPDMAILLTLALMTLVLIWRHRGNIRNLLAGDESRIGG